MNLHQKFYTLITTSYMSKPGEQGIGSSNESRSGSCSNSNHKVYRDRKSQSKGCEFSHTNKPFSLYCSEYESWKAIHPLRRGPAPPRESESWPRDWYYIVSKSQGQ